MTTSPEEGAKLLQRLRLSIVKMRSNTIEAGVDDDVLSLICPEEQPGSMLMNALEFLEERTPTWNTLNNVLSLAHRSPIIPLGYGLRWDDDLPVPYSFPFYAGGDS